MGIVQKDALLTSIISYLGIVLGYINKGVLFLALLSTDEIGIANLILAVSLLFAQFANFGTFNTVWRFFPSVRNETNSHYGFLAFNLRIALIGAAVITVLLFIFQEPIADYYSKNSQRFVEFFVWIIPTGIAILIFRLLDGYTRALHKSVFAIFVNDLLLRLVTTFFLVLYYFDLFDFETLIILFCVAQWVPVILLILYLIRLNEWKVSMKNIQIPQKMREIIYNYSGYSYLNSMGASMILTVDSLMVAGMLGLKEAGVYTTIIFLSRALSIPYGAIIRVAAPLVPNLWKDGDMGEMQEIYKKVSAFLLVSGLLLFGGVWFSRGELFSILPSDFENGVYAFLFLMIGKLIDMFCGLNTTILITSKKYRYDLIFTGLLAVLVVVLNLWLIPMYGIIGAAISTSAGLLLYNILRLLFVWTQFKLQPFDTSNIFVIGLFGLSLLLFESTNIQLINPLVTIAVKSVIFTALFMGSIYFLKIERNTVDYMDKILKRLKLKSES